VGTKGSSKKNTYIFKKKRTTKTRIEDHLPPTHKKKEKRVSKVHRGLGKISSADEGGRGKRNRKEKGGRGRHTATSEVSRGLNGQGGGNEGKIGKGGPDCLGISEGGGAPFLDNLPEV